MEDNLTSELNSISGADYPAIFKKFRSLSEKYGNMPIGNLISAYNSVNNGYGTRDPYVQNRRVKAISTSPVDYSEEDVTRFTSRPESSERQLREVERALEYSTYPMMHTRITYQNLLTYHNYVAPSLTNREDAKRDDFWREWALLEKLRKALGPKDKAHELAGRALKEGKVFVVPRVSLDKPHNKVNHAFLQRLPSNWTKIVGYNNVSKYTVAFNLMYFSQFGTDWRQFGDLFEPYMENFIGSLRPSPALRNKKIVYAQNTGLDLRMAQAAGAEAYNQNGRWFYWVTLPVDRVFPFEIDDTDDNVLPIFSGMFVDMIRLSQMEQIQLELLQSPLTAVLVGEIPYWGEKGDNTADQYMLSDAGRRMFIAFWNEMFFGSGVGIYAAPFKNMKLQSLAENTNATNIVSQGYTDVMARAGLTALIPVSDEARAGSVNVSLAIESRLPQAIYRCFERMMHGIFSKLNLNYEWQFRMFGDLATDAERQKTLQKDMTLGILPAAVEYNAMSDRSILDDIAWSDAVLESKLMDKRLPLVSSFNQSAKSVGRPTAEKPMTDGNEQDVDSGVGAGNGW